MVRGFRPVLTSDQPSAQAPRCAVLGSPIAHSLSPVLHRAAYAELGLAWCYEAVEMTEDGLPAFLDQLGPEWRGLSLTMPLKRSVVPLLDDLSERAAQAQAVNTVVLEEGRRVGHNTDIPGAACAVRERWAGSVARAVVLGGGATAASVLLALGDLGCVAATLVVRDPARARETMQVVARHPRPPALEVARLGGAVPEAVDIVVSTIPAAAQDSWVAEVGARATAVFEVLYDPWPTPLAATARRNGQVLVSGLDLLVHQAVLQVKLMTGGSAPVEALRRAGEHALAARSGAGWG